MAVRVPVDVDVNGLATLEVLDETLDDVAQNRTARIDIDTRGATRAAMSGSSVIQEAFSGAFQLVAKNAVLLVAGVAVALAGLPAIGAIAATGMVLAFGAGIAGIGIAAAAQSKEVRSAFRGVFKEIGGDVREMAIPFEATLKSIAEFIGRTFDTFAPELNAAFAKTAPILTVFANQLFRGFEKLAPAIQPLTDAFNDLLTRIGPKLDGFFTKVSDSLIGLSRTISADPELFSSLFVGLLNIIPAVINGITGLARIFKFVVDTVRAELGPALGELKTALAPITAAFGQATGGVSLLRVAIIFVSTVFTTFIQIVAGVVRVLAITIAGFTRAANSIRAAWRASLAFTRAAWTAIKTVVTSAVRAVTTVVTSSLNRQRAIVLSVMARVRGAFSSAWAAIRGVVTGGIARVVGSVSSGLGRVVSIAVGAWGRIRGAFSRGVSAAIAAVRRLPGAVAGIFSGMAGTLYSSGVRMISSLASGIRAGFSSAISAARSGLSTLRSYFPFSPAKRGPFSGSGYTTNSGEALMRDFASAISSTAKAVTPEVAGALDPLAESFNRQISPTPRTAAAATTTAAAAVGAAGGGVGLEALAALLGSLTLNVTLGMDRRTTAEWWSEGQRLATVLA